MPKVVIKSRYLTNNKHMVEYLNYMATREGVELLPDAVKGRSATREQRDFIEKHKKDMEGLHEYNYYLYCPTVENASLAIGAYVQSQYGTQQEYETIAYSAAAAKVSEEGKNLPATPKQKEWIEEHVKGLRDLLEYEDYIKNPTVENASELITAIAEYYTTDPEIYLNYMAERPGVDKGKGETHGLWNMTGKADLFTEIEKVRKTQSVAWTHIISIRREDAHRLGYESAGEWRKIVSANAGRIAKLYNIDIKNLNILGAFHNEGHHPHIHLFVYSSDKTEGIIPKKQMITTGEKMRSMFTGSMFSHDLEPMIARKNELRANISERVKIVSALYKKDYQPSQNILNSVLVLSEQLPKEGKLQYAYLNPELKEKVNDSLRQIVGADETLNNLVSEYFSLQRKLIEQYNNDPEKIEARYIDFVEHFYEPRSGKYAGKQDMTTLHNIILQCAADAKSDARSRIHVETGKVISIVSDRNGMTVNPKVVPISSAVGKSGSIEIVKKADSSKEPEAVPIQGVPFQIYDAAGNLIEQQITGTDGKTSFESLPEGNYVVEDKQAADKSSRSDEYAAKFAALTAARLIASELAALCDTVETCTRPPEKRDKERQRRHLKLRNKKYNLQEDLAR